MDEPELWIALRDLGGLPLPVAHALVRRFGSPSGVFRQTSERISATCGPRVSARLAPGPDLAAAREERSRAEVAGQRVLGLDDPDYPPRLRAIPDPPLVLYVRGRLPEDPCVAMVGSRRPAARSRLFAHEVAASVAAAGAWVVSGLAYGVDAACHAGALEARGLTACVLASGLDRPGPRGNAKLATRMLDAGGGWLSEYPPGTPARAHYFPFRNRLISGLSELVLVVEARERSGSLWTARHAADQGRDVAAVPGPIDSDLCRGSNLLIRDGAIPILESADLVEALGLSLPPAEVDSAEVDSGEVERGVGPLPERVVRVLRDGPSDLEELLRSTGLDAASLQAAVLELELAGRVERVGPRVLLRPPRER